MFARWSAVRGLRWFLCFESGRPGADQTGARRRRRRLVSGIWPMSRDSRGGAVNGARAVGVAVGVVQEAPLEAAGAGAAADWALTVLVAARRSRSARHWHGGLRLWGSLRPYFPSRSSAWLAHVSGRSCVVCVETIRVARRRSRADVHFNEVSGWQALGALERQRRHCACRARRARRACRACRAVEPCRRPLHRTAALARCQGDTDQHALQSTRARYEKHQRRDADSAAARRQRRRRKTWPAFPAARHLHCELGVSGALVQLH